jgi:Ca-activated chloride channel homolog
MTFTIIHTSLAIGTAIGTITAALWMSPSAPTRISQNHRTDDELSVSAHLMSRKILLGAREQRLAVSITSPDHGVGLTVGRPVLALAIVIDRSSSMRGAPMENARAAARSVLRQLDGRDEFAIVAYSSGAETVVPMQPATEANKTAARAAIETINDEGGTCISCGLETGAYEVTHSRVRNGVRRILLISDGQANAGTSDRDELAALAAAKAADGVSVSTVGVGLDFDENTMRRLAEVGRGYYHFVEDTVALSALFLRELETLSRTHASNVLLTIDPGSGVQLEEVYGYPMTRGSNGGIAVPVADIHAGETRRVVVRAMVPAASTGPLTISKIELQWRSVSDGVARVARTVAKGNVVDDPGEVAASIDPVTVHAVERALSARALEDAAIAYDRDGIAGAKRVLERRSQAVSASAHLDRTAIDAIDNILGEALEQFIKEPARAKKTTSVKSYELTR